MIILVLTSLIIGVFNKTYKVSDFQGQVYNINNIPSGIYQVNVGLDKFQGLLVGYGDFNSDKATDLITVNPARRDIQIQYWLTDSFHEHKVCTGCFPTEGLIQGVIPADYNYDGLLDLLIVYQTSQFGFTNYILYQEEKSENEQFSKFQTGKTPSFLSSQYPFVGDFDGDHNTNVMIYKDSVRQIYKTITSTATPLSNYASNYPGCIEVKEIVSQPFSVPIFNSFIDLNADCRADLVILSETNKQQVIEYWLTMDVENKDITNRYCLKYAESVEGITIFSMNFADMNFDGLVDMVLIAAPNIKHSEQYMIINYNNYDVQDVSKLCQSGQTSYPFDPLTLESSTHRVVTQILDTRGFQFQIYGYDDRKDLLGLFAPFLRFGDFKSTGYPEILATLENTTSNYPASYYIQNIECKGCDLLSATLKNPRMLYFDQNPQSISGINALTVAPSVNAAFFDYGENGRLDFLVNVINRTMANNFSDTYSIAAYYNYLSIDAFYLKASGLNGQCKTSNDKNLPCLGGLYYGATYMLSVTDINGVYNPGVGFQLSQSAQSPLQLPYGYMGLGRTNNFIQDFTFGIPLTKGATKKWTPIIPNSQLIISPEGDDVDEWSISIFIEPTDAISIVVIVNIMVLILLGGVIVWKHIKEKEEDKKNQETFFQMFR